MGGVRGEFPDHDEMSYAALVAIFLHKFHISVLAYVSLAGIRRKCLQKHKVMPGGKLGLHYVRFTTV